MRRRVALGVVASLLVAVSTAQAAWFTIEPDDYASGTVLNNVNPRVSLYTYVDPSWAVFDITSVESPFGFASTGTRVFAHAGVGFFNDDRRMKMTFAEPVFSISLDFGGGQHFATEIGRLEVYNAANELLETYVTAPMGPGLFETMTVTRPQGDIKYAFAYVADGDGVFGRLDNLRFNTVPEPSGLVVAGLAAAGLLGRRRCRK